MDVLEQLVYTSFLNSKNINMRWKEEIAINHEDEWVVGEKRKRKCKKKSERQEWKTYDFKYEIIWHVSITSFQIFIFLYSPFL